MNAEIREGIAPPVDPNLEVTDNVPGSSAANAMEIDPRFDTADDHGDAGGADVGGGGLEEFMNLDGIDHDHLSAFGQDFGGGGAGGGQQSPFF